MVDAETLLERVRAAPAEVDRLLVVSHNPGVTGLVRMLARKSAVDRVGGLATGALAVLDLEGPWRTLAPGTAALTELASPPPVL